MRKTTCFVFEKVEPSTTGHRDKLLRCGVWLAPRVIHIPDMWEAQIHHPVGGTTCQLLDLPYDRNLVPWPNIRYEILMIGKNGISDAAKLSLRKRGKHRSVQWLKLSGMKVKRQLVSGHQVSVDFLALLRSRKFSTILVANKGSPSHKHATCMVNLSLYPIQHQ